MINNITKTVYEKFQIEANFSHDVASDDSIFSQTLTCINILTGVDTKATIIDSHTISSDKIIIVIKSGVNEEMHHITSKIVTANGLNYECDIFLSIQDLTIDFFKKQPSEEFRVLFDFDSRIDSAETISTEDITATKISDRSNVTSEIIDSSIIDGNTVIVKIKAGAKDESYLISAKVITDINSYQIENIIRMDVIEH